MQDCGMGQRLHSRYQDESREVEIGDVDLAAMGLEIPSKKARRHFALTASIFSSRPVRGTSSSRTR